MKKVEVHKMHKGNPSRVLKIILSSLLIAFILFPMKVALAADDVEYYTNISDEELAEIFSLEVSDIPNAFDWITQVNTYVIIEERGGEYTFWWNAANMQQTFYNMLYDVLSQSGYGDGAGMDPAERSVNGKVQVTGQNGADNAMERYGFDIPSPTYYGERPLISISILGVLTPDGVFDGIGRIWDLIFHGTILNYPTDKDLDSLLYMAPRDYNTSGATFYNWVKENWDDMVSNGLPQPGQILLGTADSDGKKAGKLWIAQKILYDQGLMQVGLDPDYVVSELEVICGQYYGQVAEGIMLTSGCEQVHHYERLMPYDLSRLNSTDAIQFNGISDPRADKQENLLSTGYLNVLPNVAANMVLDVSSSLSETAVFLNRVCNFTLIEGLGFDPIALWNNSLVQFMLYLMLFAVLFLGVRAAFKVLTGSSGQFRAALNVAGTLVIALCIWGVALNPMCAYRTVKNLMTQIIDFGNAVLTNEPQIHELYGTTDAAGKEDVNLWLPYFDTWTYYNTNHGVLDERQGITGSTGPELNGLQVPEISGVRQDLWCTVLADAICTDEAYSGNIYRMVDHFMAPRITLNDPTTVDFTVKKNENWNGNIQSSINLASIPMQLLIVVLIALKVILFIEMLFDFAFLIVNMALSVTDGKRTFRYVKELFAMSVDVAMCNLIVCFVVYVSLIVHNIFLSIILFIFMVFVLYSILKTLMSFNSVFRPKFLYRPFMFLRRMFAILFAPNGSRSHKDPEDPDVKAERENMEDEKVANVEDEAEDDVTNEVRERQTGAARGLDRQAQEASKNEHAETGGDNE